MFDMFRLLTVENKIRQCAEIVLECLSSLTLEEQKNLAKFFVPEVMYSLTWKLLAFVAFSQNRQNAIPQFFY